MRRVFFLVYGLACHALFLAVYACMAVFVGNLDCGLPVIDGPREHAFGTALAIDALLVAAFAVPHSVMARPAFKARWTRLIPEPIERSTYVLVSSALMIALIWFWQPLGGVVWNVTAPAGVAALHVLFALGWLAVPAVSVLIDHFDLFGTRQVWLYFKGRPYEARSFREPGLYRYVRHPLYVGWMIAFWATPTMTVSHLFFAATLTVYMLVAIPFEERDLMRHFGRLYSDYRRRVGALIPRRARALTRNPESSRAA